MLNKDFSNKRDDLDHCISGIGCIVFMVFLLVFLGYALPYLNDLLN